MKKIFLALATLATIYTSNAQVPKAVVVEHFTNSHCGACANRNPTFFSTLATLPSVIHVAYYPSLPYPNCQINKMNITENDLRTQYYGVYGSTPRIAIQGIPINPSTNYADAGLYTQHQGQTSSFDMRISVWQNSANTAEATLIIKKVDTSSLTNVQLYGVLAQDTLFFDALNGEKQHYNLLRTAIWNASTQSITVPTNVGDSIIMTKTINLNSSWGDFSRLYAVAMLQKGDKELVQATKSNRIQHPVSITQTNNRTNNTIRIYPNPATINIQIEGINSYPSSITISSINGTLIKETIINSATQIVDISNLNNGMYLIEVNNKTTNKVLKFIKK